MGKIAQRGTVSETMQQWSPRITKIPFVFTLLPE